jgi:DNA primase
MTYDEIKQLIKDMPISNIVGQFISLKKQASGQIGLCPFHADSKPSLNVSDEKGIFKCFACGVSGDAIGFVMKKQSMEFKDAIKEIAKLTGLPFEELDQPKKENPEFTLAKRLLEASFKLYRKFTKDMNPEYFADFVKKRKLSEESIEHFGLCYAPQGNILLNFLLERPFESEAEREKAIAMALKLDLIQEKERGKYDFFRDRIMFPVVDNFGLLRGYQSRAVHDDQIPKYMNSKESFYFNKGHILFGMHFAKNSIRQKDFVIVVEGNMDVIMLHQYGFKNTVGTMGTALTDYNVSTLIKHTKNIFLALDSDEAGWKAILKANEACLKHGVTPKFISYHPAKDADEFLLQFGQLALQEKIDNAPSCIDVIIDKIIPPKIPDTIDLKLKILDQVHQTLQPMGEHLLAKEKLIAASRTLGLRASENDIVENYKKFLGQKPKIEAYIAKQEEIPVKENTVISQPITAIPAKEIPKTEQLILKEIIKHPETLSHSSCAQLLDFLSHHEVKNIVLWLKKMVLEIDENEYQSVVKNFLSEGVWGGSISEIISSALFEFKPTKLTEKQIEKFFNDSVKKIKEEDLKNRKKYLIQKQKDALSDEEQIQTLNEIKILDEEIKSLK